MFRSLKSEPFFIFTPNGIIFCLPSCMNAVWTRWYLSIKTMQEEESLAHNNFLFNSLLKVLIPALYRLALLQKLLKVVHHRRYMIRGATKKNVTYTIFASSFHAEKILVWGWNEWINKIKGDKNMKLWKNSFPLLSCSLVVFFLL